MSSGTKIEFSLENVKVAAQFVAELTKEGITFRMRADNLGIEITITGGY